MYKNTCKSVFFFYILFQCAYTQTQKQTLTYAWNALHWDLSYSLFEAGETRVNLSDLALFPLNQFLNNLLTFSNLSHKKHTDMFTKMKKNKVCFNENF